MTDSAATKDTASDGASSDDGLVVRIQGLRKVFKSFSWQRERGVWRKLRRVLRGRVQEVVAVQNLDLDIRRGEVFGLLGPNGSGKSTTIKIMLGLVAPSAGEVEVLARSPHAVDVKHRIGFLPEESYLYRFLTADETLDFYGKLFDIPRQERRERANRLVELVGLEHARNRQLREYSKGMARRIGLAQALINDPDLVILDEPTTGLDPIGTTEMKRLIERLKGEGKTVLLCSHLLADVEEVCDRVAIMCDGELLAKGPLEELLSLRDQLEVRIDRADKAFQERLRRFLESEGAAVAAMQNASDSLARLFLRLIDERFPEKIPERVRGELMPAAPQSTPEQQEQAAPAP